MVSPAKMRQLGDAGTAHRLRCVLARLGADSEVLRDEMRETATDYQNLMRLLVREIDEAVLPRKMVLRSADGIEATVISSNRRVIGLRSNETALELSADDDSETDAVALAYARTIKNISERAGRVGLQQLGRASKSIARNTSCSAARLAAQAETLGHENRLGSFFQNIQSRVLGCVMHLNEKHDVIRKGSDDILLRLDALERITKAQRDSREYLSRLERTGPSCAAFSLAPSVQAIIATDGAGKLLAAVSNDDMVAVIEDWRRVFASIGPVEPV